MSGFSRFSHTVSNTAPSNPAVGDEWYNPATKVLYKRSVTAAGAVQWIQVIGTDNTATPADGQMLAWSTTSAQWYPAGGKNLLLFANSLNSVAATLSVQEVATTTATAATGTINFDVSTQSVLYYTANASANWTLNVRGSSSASLNSIMTTGQSASIVFLATQGATAYYNNSFTIDGSAVTPLYQGGTAWSAGNASGVDAYFYTIIKTGSAAYTVLASQTQFK